MTASLTSALLGLYLATHDKNVAAANLVHRADRRRPRALRAPVTVMKRLLNMLAGAGEETAVSGFVGMTSCQTPLTRSTTAAHGARVRVRAI
jgi:hypothetical protein